MANITTLTMREPKTLSEKIQYGIEDEIHNHPVVYGLIKNPELFARNAVTFLNNSKQLVDFCKQNGTDKFKVAVLESARRGLDATKKEVYLVPRGNLLEVTPSYIGKRNIIRKYSTRPVKDMYANVVREGDEFSYSFEDGRYTYKHTPKPFASGKFVGAYAVVEFADGGNILEAISEDELIKIRNCSRTRGGVWDAFPGEMRKKAVINRLSKSIMTDEDMPTEIVEMLKQDEELDSDANPSEAEVVDIFDGE